jgi:hypothetical protein
MEPMDLPGGMGRIAGFNDPGGNWIGLFSPAKPERKTAKTAAKKPAKKPAKKAAESRRR